MLQCRAICRAAASRRVLEETGMGLCVEQAAGAADESALDAYMTDLAYRWKQGKPLLESKRPGEGGNIRLSGAGGPAGGLGWSAERSCAKSEEVVHEKDCNRPCDSSVSVDRSPAAGPCGKRTCPVPRQQRSQRMEEKTPGGDGASR